MLMQDSYDLDNQYVPVRTEAFKRIGYLHPRTHGGGGCTCHDFGYGCAAGVPEPHPIHILGQVKNMTHPYTSHIEN